MLNEFMAGGAPQPGCTLNVWLVLPQPFMLLFTITVYVPFPYWNGNTVKNDTFTMSTQVGVVGMAGAGKEYALHVPQGMHPGAQFRPVIGTQVPEVSS